MAATKKMPVPTAPKPPARQKAARSAPVKSPARNAPAGNTTAKKVGAKAPLSKPFAATKLETAALPQKVKKPKLVRDSFTIPKAEYLVLDELKQRAAKLTRPAKKSEVLRAGIKILAALSDAAFLTALEQVPAIKTGRPAAHK